MGCEGFDGVEQGESTAARDAEATNRGTDDEDEDRGYVWLCEPVAPPLERESVAGGDRGVEPTVFVWIVASYIVVYIADYVSTWCNCNHRRERVRLVRSEDRIAIGTE